MSQFDFFDPMKSPEALDHKAKLEAEHAERCRIAKLAGDIDRQIKAVMLSAGVWGYPSLVRNPEGASWPDPVDEKKAWYLEKFKLWPGFYNIEPEPEPKVIIYAYPGCREAPGITQAKEAIEALYPCEVRIKVGNKQYEYY